MSRTLPPCRRGAAVRFVPGEALVGAACGEAIVADPHRLAVRGYDARPHLEAEGGGVKEGGGGKGWTVGEGWVGGGGGRLGGKLSWQEQEGRGGGTSALFSFPSPHHLLCCQMRALHRRLVGAELLAPPRPTGKRKEGERRQRGFTEGVGGGWVVGGRLMVGRGGRYMLLMCRTRRGATSMAGGGKFRNSGSSGEGLTIGRAEPNLDLSTPRSVSGGGRAL